MSQRKITNKFVYHTALYQIRVCGHLRTDIKTKQIGIIIVCYVFQEFLNSLTDKQNEVVTQYKIFN